MFKGTEDFYSSPCEKNCKIKEHWIVEHPEIGKQLNLSAVIICLGCIHFILEDHFIPVIDRSYDK